MASYSDYDFPPKKRVTTYGKAGKKKVQATVARAVRTEGSVTGNPAPKIVATTSPSSSPEPRPPPRATASSSRIRQQTTRSSRMAQPKPAEEAHSQPLPDTLGAGDHDDDARAKKRRLMRTYSEKQEKSAGPYSTPDSSPSDARSPVRPMAKEIPRSIPAPRRQPKAQTTPEKDVKMKDDVSQGMPFSAKTSRALDNLSVSVENPGRKNQQIPLRLSRVPKAPVAQSAVKKKSPPPASSKVQSTVAQVPRKRRLIDALVSQAEGSSSEEDEALSQETAVSEMRRSSPVLHSSSPPPSSSPHEQRPVVRPVLATKKSGPKFTYSQKRTMLAEEDDLLLGGTGLGGIDEEPSKGALFDFGRLPKTTSAFSFLDEDDETANTGAVRSIHELRQAGANSRFADEMEDIMDRVGSPSEKPSSMRRGALLELAQKIREKDFRRQFRNHGDGGGLFKNLGEEMDLVSGYSIVATLTTLLATSVSAHLVQQLGPQGLAALLSRLLKEMTDIGQLARDRKQNVSRNGQTTLGTVKLSILKLPIWEPISPTSLSPRTLALKCLDLVMRQSTHSSGEAEIFSTAVTDQLFDILAAGSSNKAAWDFPGQQESCDLYLALYVLEGHSINAMQSRLGARWTSKYVPIVANVLETALRRPADKYDDLESLALRITLNTTNTNQAACCQLVDQGLLRDLAESACGAFEVFLNSMKVDAFLSKVHESLIMMLGVMINFCVYHPPASQSLEEREDVSRTPLNRLIRVFADNHAKTSDADSMEKTQLNVALGYLSILLGYLCLNSSIRDRFLSVHPKRSLQPLLDSINEFIRFHQEVAEARAGEEGSKQETEFAALSRLQSLVVQLETQHFD
ncbi:wings apart-like protein regulation of heterochromatin-domain-containing protein [Podospora appendiculata]|uniref:Wings apart-like protein regulation of heterochromatin-domain-containing protein n=1 Tax=Podospora appendiculata TaxID=314037 RepID=A0AAE1CAV9_9PEZI|nr:wings apart-like protein regulation of heterochromatin-domain-containing protein [Podospora appendiculata]